jgi:hypothetical protein
MKIKRETKSLFSFYFLIYVMIKSIELKTKDHSRDYFLEFSNDSCILDVDKEYKRNFIASNKIFFDLIQRNNFRPFLLDRKDFTYDISWQTESNKVYHYSIKINHDFIEEENLSLIEKDLSSQEQDYNISFSTIYNLISILGDKSISFGEKWYSEGLNDDEVIDKLYLEIPDRREHLLLPKIECLHNTFKYLLEDVEIYFQGEEFIISHLELKKDESLAMRKMLTTLDLGISEVTEDWRFLVRGYEMPLEDLGSGTNYLMERLPQLIKTVFRGKTYFETDVLYCGRLHPLLRNYIPIMINVLTKQIRKQLGITPGQVIFLREKTDVQLG